MNNLKQEGFGLDDFGENYSVGTSDPKPLYNEKSQREQDKALQNPEQSIDKDPNKPWVQNNWDQAGVKREESSEKIQDEFNESSSEDAIDYQNQSRNRNES